MFTFVSYITNLKGSGFFSIYPPASEASREVANKTERKNPYTPVYGVKEFVRVPPQKMVKWVYLDLIQTVFLG